MNQIIKKLIIEPLIYPFYRGNYKNFVILGLVLSLSVYFYFYIEDTYWLFIISFLRTIGLNEFFALLIFSFLLYYIEIGYITMIFESSIKGEDNIPSLRNIKRLFICGLKGIGYSTIYAAFVWGISTLIYFAYFGKIPYPFNDFNYIHTIYDITLFDILFVILVILFSSLLPATGWNTLLIPNTCPEFWNMIFSNYRLLSLLISCYITPLIIFKLYNRKIEIRKCLSSFEYLLIATISGICFILIFKYIVFLDVEKVFIIFYLLTVIARMFGVYFKEIAYGRDNELHN